VLQEAVRAAKKVIVVAEEIVAREVIASDPNRTVVPGFLVSAVVDEPFGAHPSPVQGYYSRDNDFFRAYHAETKTADEYARWKAEWVENVRDRKQYLEVLGSARSEALRIKKHAFSAPADFGY
jgi:glutaconate CoA-transferase subunit A